MLTTYFDNISYSENFNLMIFLTGVEYDFNPLQSEKIQGVDPEQLATYKRVANVKNKRDPKEEAKLSPSDLEIYNHVLVEIIQPLQKEFDGKDKFGREIRTGQEKIKHQEKMATSTKFICLQRKVLRDNFNRKQYDEFNETLLKTEQKGTNQNANLKIVVPIEYIAELRKKISEKGGTIKVDFKNGYLNPINDKISVLYAETIVIDGQEKKIPISKANINNQANQFTSFDYAGDWNLKTNPQTSQQQVKQEQTTQNNSTKKEEK